MAIRNGKVALITGANRGLGKEIGRQLGVLGYTVVGLVTVAREKFPYGQLCHRGERLPW